jgi:hypothetical protein
MSRSGFALIVAGFLLSIAEPIYGLEYDRPDVVQKYPGKGWLLDSSSRRGLHTRTYLESKQLLVSQDGIYYMGTALIEGADAPPGKIRWHYLARCSVRPDLRNTIPVGISYNMTESDEQFTQFDENAVSSANAGWLQLWWAICRNQRRQFN